MVRTDPGSANRFLVCVALLLFLVGVLNSTGTLGQSAPKDSVTLYLRWKHQYQFAGYYIALEKGFYAEAGVHIKIKEYDGQNNVGGALVEGVAQYGSELGGLILSDTRSSELAVLGTVYQRSPVILLTVDPAIESLNDLAGKKVTGLTEVQAMLTSAGVFDQVDFIKGSKDLEGLLSGEFCEI